MTKLTHFNQQGEAHMVDVGTKDITVREAAVEGRIYMHESTLELIMKGDHKKGDVLGIARVAGIMGAKKTPDLVPLCHPLLITNVELDLTPEPETNSVYCTCVVGGFCNNVRPHRKVIRPDQVALPSPWEGNLVEN